MNYLQHPMQNPGDISNPTTAFNMALALMAKAFTLNDTTPTNNNQRSSSNPSNMQIAQPEWALVLFRNCKSAWDEMLLPPAENRCRLIKRKKQGIQLFDGHLISMAVAGAGKENKRAKYGSAEHDILRAFDAGKRHCSLLKEDTNKGTSANTKFAKQSILGKLPSSSRPKTVCCKSLPNSTAFPTWSPTGRFFDLKGKIITSSESESQSDFSKGCQNWFDTLLIPLLSEYKSKDKASHGDNECDT
ncbi:hypothetical protein Tco_0261324 [Tanacetum coccineum]